MSRKTIGIKRERLNQSTDAIVNPSPLKKPVATKRPTEALTAIRDTKAEKLTPALPTVVAKTKSIKKEEKPEAKENVKKRSEKKDEKKTKEASTTSQALPVPSSYSDYDVRELIHGHAEEMERLYVLQTKKARIIEQLIEERDTLQTKLNEREKEMRHVRHSADLAQAQVNSLSIENESLRSGILLRTSS